jgi:hypothetical protein
LHWLFVKHNLFYLSLQDGFWRSPGTVAGTVGAYVAVTGSLCFLGRLQNTFAANLDVDGNFWTGMCPGLMFTNFITNFMNQNWVLQPQP